MNFSPEDTLKLILNESNKITTRAKRLINTVENICIDVLGFVL